MDKAFKIDQLIFRAMALLVGLGIFAYSVKNFGGLSEVWRQLKLLDWGYLAVIANSSLWMLGYTVAWRLYLTDQHHLVPYFSLLRIKLCGEAVNFMTPLGFVLGDSVRVMLLQRFLGPEARLRSVVVDRATHSLAAQFFCLTSVWFVFTQPVDFPRGLFLVVFLTYLVIFSAMLTLVVSMLRGRGFGLFDPLFHRLNIHNRFPKLHERLETLRDDLEFYTDKPKRPFVVAFLYHLFGRYLGAVEILIIGYFFHGEWLFGFSLVLAALTSFFSIVFGFIPGALGVIETLYAQFYAFYGFRPEYGLTVQIIRRLRVLFWVVLGVLILDIPHIKYVVNAHWRHKNL